jgi:hypothetical protein
LDKTQQEFAVELVKTAITTVARWETSHPPRGDALIRLAEVADRNDRPSLAEEFRILYADEAIANIKVPMLAKINSMPGTAEPYGYVIAKFENSDQLSAAINLLQGIKNKER